MVIKIVIFLQHRLLGNWKSIFDRACDQKDVGLKIHVRFKVGETGGKPDMGYTGQVK